MMLARAFTDYPGGYLAFGAASFGAAVRRTAREVDPHAGHPQDADVAAERWSCATLDVRKRARLVPRAMPSRALTPVAE
jgi:hypothetical protein